MKSVSPFPTRHEYHASCENLVEGRFDALLSVTTAVKRLSAGVERQRRLVLSYVDVESYVRIADRYIRSLACQFTELIDDGVLHLVGDEARVFELFGIDHRVNRECLSFEDIFAPINLLHLVVHVLCTLRLEVGDGLQHTDGGV